MKETYPIRGMSGRRSKPFPLHIHRYEWRTRFVREHGVLVEYDEYRCKRSGCKLSYDWHFANREEH